MVRLDALVENEGKLDALDSELFTTGTALEEIIEIPVRGEQIHRLRMGNAIVLRGRDAIAQADEAIATSGDQLIAIGEVDRGQFKPRRVFKHSFV